MKLTVVEGVEQGGDMFSNQGQTQVRLIPQGFTVSTPKNFLGLIPNRECGSIGVNSWFTVLLRGFQRNPCKSSKTDALKQAPESALYIGRLRLQIPGSSNFVSVPPNVMTFLTDSFGHPLSIIP